ncbi:PAS domain S-box protein [Pseudomonas gregormendelii]|uniref:histidine kinase n=2 Tax=Pseudomonas gregormendelii TaxID=1628277 RepID=A0ABS3APN0_9PSED|nr:PAS domain S-box protein [Pseudomonas gregormendelii]
METTVAADSVTDGRASPAVLQRIGAIALSSGIFIIDSLTSIEIAVAVLYVAVILIAINVFSRRGVVGVSLACIGLTLSAFFIAHGADLYSASFARCLVSLSAIGITTLLALKNKASSDELQEQVRLLAQTHDAIIVRDMDQIITSWNAGAEALYGWSASQAVGQDFRTLLNPQLAIPWSEMMTALLKTGQWEGEVVEHGRDGNSISVISRCSLSRDDNGNPKAILATHNDISQRKQAINDLRRSEAFLAGAQRLSQTGSIGLKIPGGDMYWSEEARRIFEFGDEEQPALDSILGKTHPDDIDLIKKSVDDAYREQPFIKVEYRLLMGDARIKHVQMLAHSVADASGNVEYIGALMDVTDTKLSEEALHRSQQELAHVTRLSTLGELAASIAHEVNQPLAAVSTNGTAGLRWLARDVPNLEEARSAIERMMSETHRASEVIRRIRAMSRKTAPQTMALDLSEVVSESLELVKRELKRSKVILTYKHDGHPALIVGDRVQLQQVIINLIMNAMQAMGHAKSANRTLNISVRHKPPSTVDVDIQDSGPGISPEQIPKLFEAFYTTKTEGMGMGLSICRSIVEAHGGRVWATCQPGEGAVFHLSFPLGQEEHP